MTTYSRYFLAACMLLINGASAMAQFAPQVPLPGNTAIKADSSLVKEWANSCTVYRGYVNITDTGLGRATAGADSNAVGSCNGSVVSLGDSGVAVLTFPYPITNGDGPDFAVFENGFAHPTNDTIAFLELAFVEVSSDGVNYVRFPAISTVQDSLQMDNFSYADARWYHNLAGKYKADYGTPFDLEELKDSTGLDVQNITHVRLVDVVGSITRGVGCTDSEGTLINDPFPTPYPSSGFDLAGVAVLYHNTGTAINTTKQEPMVHVYPNPANQVLHIKASGNTTLRYTVTGLNGLQPMQGTLTNIDTTLHTTNWANGLYLLRVLDTEGNQQTLKILKQAQ
ncbi:MAG: T9SS type A sorting domain-containing protein [Edaphocola sp.]